MSAVVLARCKSLEYTADIIAKRSNLKVQQSSDWREIDMGEWEDRTMTSLHREVPELVAQLFADPASFEYPSGEAFAAFTARVQTALAQLLSLTEVAKWRSLLMVASAARS